MKDKIKPVKEGTIDIFLGYKKVDGHPLPYGFTKAQIDELDDMVVSPARYPLEKIATHLTAADPDIKIGMLARDCNQRALNVLAVWNQIKPEHIRTINVNCCPSNLKEHGDRSYLEPETAGAYKKQVGVDNNLRPAGYWIQSSSSVSIAGCMNFKNASNATAAGISARSASARNAAWSIRNLIGTGALPPEVPIFHLVRAVHMAGRCIDCGLCEDACPVDIPVEVAVPQGQ